MTITEYDERFDGPLHVDEHLRQALEQLLQRANRPQLWWIFLDESDGVTGPLMPFDGYPDDPFELVRTDDLGEMRVAGVLAERMNSVGELVGAHSAALVWEQPGPDEPTTRTRLWAREMALACRATDLRLRMQFLLHDGGLRTLTLDDYV